MSTSSALISSAPNISNFHNLALFICKLFIDGHFRNAQILYDPHIFDGRLMDDFGSVCSSSFPWRTMDITQASQSTWHQDERTRNELQLIFFDSNHLADEVDHFKKFFTFYPILVFSSTNEMNVDENFNITALHYNIGTGSIQIHWVLELDDDVTEKSEHRMSVDSRTTAMRQSDTKVHKEQLNLFDCTFEKKEQMKSIVVRVAGWFREDEQSTDLESNPQRRFFTNYYLQMLDTRFIQVTFVNAANPKSPSSNQLSVFQQQKSYKELSGTIHEVNGNENS